MLNRTFVVKACTRDQEQGSCSNCDHGQTYTEHSNGMNRCLPCTHCRTEVSGGPAVRFRNDADAPSEKKGKKEEETSLSALPNALTAAAAAATASSSSSPSSSSSCSSGGSPHHSPARPEAAPHRHGSEKSLRKSFDLFDEYLDVRIHNKFFRFIGVSDNRIVIAEGVPPGDKVYDLLKSWMQREGLKADINGLLDALLSMDQRRSAESIACAALQKGYYRHADTP
ncbi:hypothetical protein CRUP_009370 [Coryphaenoides rupestris]|nr:hypothetical protein CRUP_009370 [Coryphaenoides rupestris]